MRAAAPASVLAFCGILTDNPRQTATSYRLDADVLIAVGSEDTTLRSEPGPNDQRPFTKGPEAMRNSSPRKSPLVVLWAALGATALAASGLIVGAAAPDAVARPTEWKHWGGDPGVSRFSPLDQITAANVAQLQPAWVYDTATFGRSWEVTPLLVDGLLYIADPKTTDVVALEPESGKELWRHKPPSGLNGGDIRGLSYWEGDGSMKPRIIMIWGHNMFGLDPKSGQLSADWPATGHNIMLPPVGMSCATESECGGVPQKSPPVIYKNLIILADASGFLPYPVRPADPRAYDLRTGKLTWISRLVPNPGEEGGDSWGPDPRNVAGNGSWGILSLDEKTGTVYVPTDSGSPDLVGIWRPGDGGCRARLDLCSRRGQPLRCAGGARRRRPDPSCARAVGVEPPRCDRPRGALPKRPAGDDRPRSDVCAAVPRGEGAARDVARPNFRRGG